MLLSYFSLAFFVSQCYSHTIVHYLPHPIASGFFGGPPQRLVPWNYASPQHFPHILSHIHSTPKIFVFNIRRKVNKPVEVAPAIPQLESANQTVCQTESTEPAVPQTVGQSESTNPTVLSAVAQQEPTNPAIPQEDVQPESTNPAVPQSEVQPESTNPTVPQLEVQPESTNPAVPQPEVQPESTNPIVPESEVQLESTNPSVPQPEVQPESTNPAVPESEVQLESTNPAVPQSDVQPESTIQSPIQINVVDTQQLAENPAVSVESQLSAPTAVESQPNTASPIDETSIPAVAETTTTDSPSESPVNQKISSLFEENMLKRFPRKISGMMVSFRTITPRGKSISTETVTSSGEGPKVSAFEMVSSNTVPMVEKDESNSFQFNMDKLTSLSKGRSQEAEEAKAALRAAKFLLNSPLISGIKDAQETMEETETELKNKINDLEPTPDSDDNEISSKFEKAREFEPEMMMWVKNQKKFMSGMKKLMANLMKE